MIAWVGLVFHVRAEARVFGVLVWCLLIGFVESEGDGRGLYGWCYQWLIE